MRKGIKLNYIVETEEDTQSHSIKCATTLGAMNWLLSIMEMANLVSATIENGSERLLAVTFKR